MGGGMERHVLLPAAYISLFLVSVVIALALAIASVNRRRFPTHRTGGVVITGASSGIGRHVAITLASRGYRVFAGVRTQEDAELLRAEVPGGGGGDDNLQPVILDVTRVETIDRAVKIVTEDLASRGLPLVGIINNAGVFYTSPLEFLDLDKTKKLFEVNVVGVLAMTQRFTPLLRTHQGRVINVGSIAGVTAPAFYSAYSASKYALEAITDVTRLELAPWRISVSLLQPGFIQTRLYEPDRHDLTTNLTPDQQRLYAQQLAFETKKKEFSVATSAGPSTVTSEVLHALSSPYPKTRYLAGTYNGKPIGIIRATAYLPDRVQDSFKLPPDVLRAPLPPPPLSRGYNTTTAPSSSSGGNGTRNMRD